MGSKKKTDDENGKVVDSEKKTKDSDEEEEAGLDVEEHGVSGYANFMMSHER